jgi:peptidoglycan hydrolase CwlO-like protein
MAFSLNGVEKVWDTEDIENVISNAFAQMQARIEELEKEVETLEGEIESKQDHIDELESDLKDANDKIEELEEQLEGVNA